MSPANLALLQTVLSGVVAVLVALTLYTMIVPLLERGDRKNRRNSVATARETLRKTRNESLNSNQGLRTNTKSNVKGLVKGLSLEKLLEATNLRDKLAQAGLRGERPMYMFYFFRLSLPIGLGAYGLIFLIILNVPEWVMIQRFAVTIGLMVFGYYLPSIYIKNVASKRLAAILPVFPDALDLLLICVESGMSVELAFAKVAGEMADSSIELAEELSLTTAELSYLQNRSQAYENFARRNNYTGIKAVSTALIQAERYGTPLGDSLRTMAAENRELRILQAEKKAASLPAKLTVPMILFFLPVLFIIVMTPAGMRIAESFKS